MIQGIDKIYNNKSFGITLFVAKENKFCFEGFTIFGSTNSTFVGLSEKYYIF